MMVVPFSISSHVQQVNAQKVPDVCFYLMRLHLLPPTLPSSSFRIFSKSFYSIWICSLCDVKEIIVEKSDRSRCMKYSDKNVTNTYVTRVENLIL